MLWNRFKYLCRYLFDDEGRDVFVCLCNYPFNEELRKVLRYFCHEMDDQWRECGCGEINLCPPDGDQRHPVYSEHHHCHHHHIIITIPIIISRGTSVPEPFMTFVVVLEALQRAPVFIANWFQGSQPLKSIRLEASKRTVFPWNLDLFSTW